MLEYSVKEVYSPFSLLVNPKVFFGTSTCMCNSKCSIRNEERHTQFTMKTIAKIERDPGVGGINVPASCPGMDDISTVIGLF